MRRLIIALALYATAACSASPRPRVIEAAAPAEAIIEPARTGHAAVNLTGAWGTGSGIESSAKEIVLHPECNYSPALWIIQQDGDSVRAWTVAASHAQGIAKPPEPRPVPAEGVISGVDATLGSPDARYVLHYDSTSGHLRGTLNGAPFWAVRVDVVRPGGCIPPP